MAKSLVHSNRCANGLCKLAKGQGFLKFSKKQTSNKCTYSHGRKRSRLNTEIRVILRFGRCFVNFKFVSLTPRITLVARANCHPYLYHCSDLVAARVADRRRLLRAEQSLALDAVTFTINAIHNVYWSGLFSDKTFSHLMYVRATLHWRLRTTGTIHLWRQEKNGIVN